jgi:hypothetical protein
VAVSVQAMGPLCGNAVVTVEGVAEGVATNTTTFDPVTGAATHLVQCRRCTLTPLTVVSIALHPTCTALVLQAGTVGANGSHYIAALRAPSQCASGGAGCDAPRTVELVATPMLETVVDRVKNVGVRGYGLTPSALLSATDGKVAGGDASGRTVARVSLSLSPWYHHTEVTNLISPAQLVSSIAGLLSLVGAAGTVIGFMRAQVKPRVKKASIVLAAQAKRLLRRVPVNRTGSFMQRVKPLVARDPLDVMATGFAAPTRAVVATGTALLLDQEFLRYGDDPVVAWQENPWVDVALPGSPDERHEGTDDGSEAGAGGAGRGTPRFGVGATPRWRGAGITALTASFKATPHGRSRSTVGLPPVLRPTLLARAAAAPVGTVRRGSVAAGLPQPSPSPGRRGLGTITAGSSSGGGLIAVAAGRRQPPRGDVEGGAAHDGADEGAGAPHNSLPPHFGRETGGSTVPATPRRSGVSHPAGVALPAATPARATTPFTRPWRIGSVLAAGAVGGGTGIPLAGATASADSFGATSSSVAEARGMLADWGIRGSVASASGSVGGTGTASSVGGELGDGPIQALAANPLRRPSGVGDGGGGGGGRAGGGGRGSWWGFGGGK